jgi:hypothetical protein
VAGRKKKTDTPKKPNGSIVDLTRELWQAAVQLRGSIEPGDYKFVAPPFQEVVAARAWTGSTVDRTPLTEFPDYPLLWPGQALVTRFSEEAAPMWTLIHHNQNESRTLAALRDTLLPKLLSGEIRLRQAEKAVEAAL